MVQIDINIGVGNTPNQEPDVSPSSGLMDSIIAELNTRIEENPNTPKFRIAAWFLMGVLSAIMKSDKVDSDARSMVARFRARFDITSK